MDRGQDFLKSQVNNAVMQHQTFLKNLEDHESQAEDARYRDLCTRFIPHAREHQRMLESYQQSIGAELGAGKKAVGAALGMARDLADAARESDFLRLAQLGEVGERHHDEYTKEANRLVQQMFVEHVRGVEAVQGGDVRATPSAGLP